MFALLFSWVDESDVPGSHIQGELMGFPDNTAAFATGGKVVMQVKHFEISVYKHT